MGYLHVRDYPGRAHLNNMSNTNETPCVVIPVSALEAMFQAQTKQVELIMNGLQSVTAQLCATALKLQERDAEARAARLNAAR